MPAKERVAVFIDYQNVYKAARRAFERHNHHTDGQIYPRRVGLSLRGMTEADGHNRELVAVRVYRGMPSNRHDPKGYSACNRQVDIWRHQKMVEPVTRPINYRDPSKPVEKGIDVQIAVDYVAMAMRQEYDVGVMFSGDTDLLPALEFVADRLGLGAVETAAWAPKRANPIILRLGQKRIRFHYLNEQVYDRVHDPTDYNRQRRRR